MALDRIRLHAFRNHRATALDGTARFNLLIGDNGAGKTNILEAISLFAPGRGLRRAPLTEMAAHAEPGTASDGGFSVGADLTTTPAQDPVRLGTGTSAAQLARRIVQVNGADTTAVALGEWLGIFWLTPAMDRIFSDSPGSRRRFLDRLVLALEPAHARHAARYEAALRERNRLIADPAPLDPRWLDGLEAQLAEAGAALSAGRERLVTRLATALAAMSPSPFARPDLTYQPGGPPEREPLAAALAAGRGRDRGAGRTLIGPHRDELAVMMAGKAAPAAACSTGEQKAMLIAITLAHCGLAAGDGAAHPRLLLLDEVAAHLDPLRRAALFAQLAAGPAQVWMTGTEAAPFSEIAPDAARWQVAAGAVSP